MMKKTSLELCNYRLGKAIDMLNQAKLLYENKQYDGCINRSYYAIFNTIRCLLALISIDSRKHSGVISFFDRYFVKTEICKTELSKIAHEAFNIRQDSDYEDFFKPSKEESKQQLNNAILFIEEVKKVKDFIVSKKIPLPKVGD
ncbi:MAG: HEPN domain-containing protein [Clostridiaceae bacterium]|nr:HEPN domain-containing protein [Clostridiaceae bacterium]